ncbi:DUF6541 family protein [Kineococcus rubinsiae]|uniref:DUF6541 family protein n=1 Tax=Kineococcus rubinsiae TaxID=2609562 RepID=UPI00142F8E06|nr:DUF6541 family protein [Kineococcus rubinsiae]NIZ91521.1 hypothetical protein [Kineococcus rubinsiae]
MIGTASRWVEAGTPLTDAATLLAAAAWILVPGVLVLRAAGVRRLALLLGAAAPVSLGVLTLAAAGAALAGVPFAWWSAAVVAVVVVLLTAVAHRVLRGRRDPDGERARTPRARTETVVVAVLLVAAAAYVLELTRRGFGTLGTPSQEYDVVTHTMVTARLLFTGDAAPWRALALDPVTGAGARYYPSGLHEWAAIVAGTGSSWGATAVSGFNATSVLVLALVQPLGLLALGDRALERHGRVAGAAAALVSVLAYQPLQAMHHDSGALPNATAIALGPGLIALLLPPRDVAARGRAVAGAVLGLRPLLPRVLPVALGCIGAVSVHPTAAVTAAGGVGGWLLGELLLRRRWPLPCRWAVVVAGAAVLAGLVLRPMLGSAATAGVGSSTRFARDVPATDLRSALWRVLSQPLQGAIDPDLTHHQWWLAVAVVVGALLAGRRAGGALVAWLLWTAVSVAFLTGATGPGLTTIWDTAYNSYFRISGHGSGWAWLLAGVGAVRLAELVGARTSRAAVAVPVVAGVLALAVAAGTAVQSGPTEVRALRERYADPQYQRVDDDDLAAGRWLAANVAPGERVLNSGNDGSTYDYVLYEVPILSATVVGTGGLPGVRTLLAHFREFPTDPAVRAIAREEDVRWVVVDGDAPWLPIRGEVAQFFSSDVYQVPPGLQGLDDVPGVSAVFRSGTVTVYAVDPAALAAG